MSVVTLVQTFVLYCTVLFSLRDRRAFIWLYRNMEAQRIKIIQRELKMLRSVSQEVDFIQADRQRLAVVLSKKKKHIPWDWLIVIANINPIHSLGKVI